MTRTPPDKTKAKRDRSRPRGGGPPPSNPSNPGELMDMTPIPTPNPAAPLSVDSVAAAAALNPPAPGGFMPSAPASSDPSPLLQPLAQVSETQSAGAVPPLSGESSWAAQVDKDAAANFIPVHSKTAQRRERQALYLAERQQKYRSLYEAGMLDKDVRAVIAKVRDDVVASMPPDLKDRYRIPKTKASAAAGGPESSDSRKRGFVPATPTGFTPREKQQRQSATPLPGAPAKTWAEMTARHEARRKAAQAKPKEDFPFMLEVYSGVDTRDSVPQDLFVPFRKALMAEVFVNLAKPKEDRIPLKIGFTQWSQAKQAILIACQDDISQGWCRAQVDGITLEPDLCFRAWDPIT